MGQTTDLDAALAELKEAREVAELADFVARCLARQRAANAAKAAGVSARDFAAAAGISKSQAGRALRDAPMTYAVNPLDAELVDELIGMTRRRVQQASSR